MKKFISIVALFILTNLTILANDNYSNLLPSDSIAATSELILDNAFYSNEANDLVFIDFEDIQLSINTINIIQNDVTIMEEDVKDLPQDMIHEIDLTIFEKGKYTIELITKDNIEIRKNIVID